MDSWQKGDSPEWIAKLKAEREAAKLAADVAASRRRPMRDRSFNQIRVTTMSGQIVGWVDDDEPFRE